MLAVAVVHNLYPHGLFMELSDVYASSTDPLLQSVLLSAMHRKPCVARIDLESSKVWKVLIFEGL